MVHSARTGVFAQDQARPVERAGEHPARLQTRAFTGLNFDRAPLAPQGGAGEGCDQGHREHGQQQGRAALAFHGDPAATPGLTQSSVSLPLTGCPSATVSNSRTPSGNAFCAGLVPPALDSGLLQLVLRK